MNLSEHFTLEEFEHSDVALRHGLQNRVSSAMYPKAVWLAERFEEVRAIVGRLHCNSVYRCAEVNHLVGSKPSSQHLKLEAGDFISLDELSPLEMCHKIARSSVKFDQLIFEFDSWMHVSFVQQVVPRRSIITINSRGVFPGIVQSEVA